MVARASDGLPRPGHRTQQQQNDQRQRRRRAGSVAVTVLHLTGVQVESQVVDVAPTGQAPSLGDSFVLSENLLRDGRRVGVSGVVCTFVRLAHPPSALQCVITARIGSDQLTIQGLGVDQPRNVFAITGGTGRWRNAGGQVVVRDVSDTESAITLFISDLG